MGQNAHLYSHGAFLWSLEKHLPDVALMIFHHGEVAWTSVYKFHDWSMGRGGSLLTTDYTPIPRYNSGMGDVSVRRERRSPVRPSNFVFNYSKISYKE